MIYIYGLYDRTGRLRYIGQAKDPWERLKGHWGGRNRNKGDQRWQRPVNKWLRKFKNPPEMRVLMEVNDDYALIAEESAIKMAIEKYGTKQILNVAHGAPTPEMRFHWSSIEFKDKVSSRSKENWGNTEYRAKQKTTRVKLASTPEGKAQLMAAASKRWGTPESRAAQVARTQAMNEDPEIKARQKRAASEYHKKLWEDPEYRAKMTAAASGRKHDAKSRSAMSAAQKKRWKRNRH